MRVLSILIIFFVTSCLAMPKKNMKQDENFQKCKVLKIINECHVVIQVGPKMYVSKLAGLSFDIKDCHKSWTKKQIRQFKICLFDYKLSRRSDNYHLYLLDVSQKKDFSEIILVCKNLNGYYNFNRLILNLGATYDNGYQGPYSKSLKENFLEAKETSFGLFGEFDKEWFNRVTPKGFKLENFIEGKPSILGEWKPTPEDIKIMEKDGVLSK